MRRRTRLETFVRILCHLFTGACLAVTAIILAVKLCRHEPLDKGPAAPRPRLIRIFLWTAAAAIGSRIALLGFCALCTDVDGFSGLVNLWNHWDAPHYMDLTRFGYVDDRTCDQWLFIVFFPLYPWLVGLVSRLGVDTAAAGMLVSWLALCGAAFLLYLLVFDDYGPDAARRAVKYMLIFPVTVFLGAQYTESLFLLVSLACLYAIRKKRWALAGAAGLLAALTRIHGILMAAVFFVEFLRDRGLIGPGWWQKVRALRPRTLRSGLWIFLIPLGTVIYIILNQIVYGDPLMFLKIQANHWGQTTRFLSGVLFSTLRNAWTDDNMMTVLYLWLFQSVTMITALAAMPAMARRMRASHGLLMALYITISFSASMLLSAARYMMGLAVLYPALAVLTRKRWVDWTLTAVFLALALIMARGFALYAMVL